MDGFHPTGSTAASLAQDFAASAGQQDRDGRFPFAHFDRLREAGLLGLTIPTRFGGQGAGLAEAAALVGTIGEGCASTALVLAMHLMHGLACTSNPAWAEATRARIGADMAQGGLVNTLRVEPALGTPARGGLPATIARRTGAGWSVRGHKIYSTGAPGLSWMLVWARTDEAAPRTGFVLVPARALGVEVRETWDQLGLRASGSHDVLFHDVAIPAEYAVELRPPEAWGPMTAEQAAWNAVLIGALYTGVARAARQWLVGFLRDRAPSNLGAPLASLPRMQEAVGAIEARLTVNARLIASVAAARDAGAPPPQVEGALIKTAMAEAAIEAVDQAMRLAGNHAMACANPIERHWRDVLCARIHSPQADTAHLAAGRLALGV